MEVNIGFIVGGAVAAFVALYVFMRRDLPVPIPTPYIDPEDPEPFPETGYCKVGPSEFRPSRLEGVYSGRIVKFTDESWKAFLLDPPPPIATDYYTLPLRQENGNGQDYDAIRVFNEDMAHMGYLESPDREVLVRHFDAGNCVYAHISDIHAGEDGVPFECKVKIGVYELTGE